MENYISFLESLEHTGDVWEMSVTPSNGFNKPRFNIYTNQITTFSKLGTTLFEVEVPQSRNPINGRVLERQTEANARLASAAPEMLKILAEISMVESHNLNSDMTKKIVAIIAKATGIRHKDVQEIQDDCTTEICDCNSDKMYSQEV